MSRTRECPGCGTRIRPAMYACGGCWRRLPGNLKTAILKAWGRRQHGVRTALQEHEDAKAAAGQWLQDNPR